MNNESIEAVAHLATGAPELTEIEICLSSPFAGAAVHSSEKDFLDGVRGKIYIPLGKGSSGPFNADLCGGPNSEKAPTVWEIELPALDEAMFRDSYRLNKQFIDDLGSRMTVVMGRKRISV